MKPTPIVLDEKQVNSLIVTRLDKQSNGYFVVESNGKQYDLLKINLPDGNNICIEFLEKNKFNVYSLTSKNVKFTPESEFRTEFKMEIEN